MAHVTKVARRKSNKADKALTLRRNRGTEEYLTTRPLTFKINKTKIMKLLYKIAFLSNVHNISQLQNEKQF